MPRRPEDEYIWRKRSAAWMLLSPGSVGSVGAATMALLPRNNIAESFLTRVPIPGLKFLVGDGLTSRLCSAVLGFLFGFGAVKGTKYVRWKLLKVLLRYKGWIYHPRALKTKLWGIAVQILEGPEPFSTYKFQSVLPKQPLPDLDDTLNLWLQVSKNWLTEDEYECTVQAVEDFRKNDGPKLQKYLQERDQKTVNYISDYWLQAAYLAARTPLAVHSNYSVACKMEDHLCPDQLTRAAAILYVAVEFERIVSSSKLPPVMIQEFIPLCMGSYKTLCNGVRIPGEYIDSLNIFPGHKHVIIIRKGHYFKMNTYYTDGKRTRHLRPDELKSQLIRICEEADRLEPELPLAAMTGQKRNIWAKQREELKKKNKESLEDLESALLIMVLDETQQKDNVELMKRLLCGSGENRWYDKGLLVTVSADAVSGWNTEHSAIDAMVHTSIALYVMYEEAKHFITSIQQNDYLPHPTRVEWDVSDMKSQINQAYTDLKQLIDDLDVFILVMPEGKGYMKKLRVSPDGYVQMAMQLGFYRMYKYVPKTYEPSTARLFAMGRTETVHVGSEQSIEWIKSMDDPEVPSKKKAELLRAAIKVQSRRRLDATVGGGCDRHLLALYCASMEMGMDAPRIFTDKAWRMPYILSTSQTPNRLFEANKHFVYKECNGIFGPSDAEGYGICYIFYGDEVNNYCITSWKSCEETNSKKLGAHIGQALEDMKKIMTEAQKSK